MLKVSVCLVRHISMWFESCYTRCVGFVVDRGNALLQSLFAGPMVLIKDPLQNRPKVVEPLKVAQEILQVLYVYRSHNSSPVSLKPRVVDLNQLT